MGKGSTLSPADAEKPGARGSDGRFFGRDEAMTWATRRHGEPIEVKCRREGIVQGRASLAGMVVTVIVEDVDEGASNFERRSESARMVAIGKDGARPREPVVEATR